MTSERDGLRGDAPPLEEFIALLDRCWEQVQADPSGYQNNPHLYGLLQAIYLRLCHGNIPDTGKCLR